MSKDVPQTPTPQTPAESFSLASAYDGAWAIFNALPKTKQREFAGALNEVSVVLTGVAGLLGVVYGSPEWRQELRKLPRRAAERERAADLMGPESTH